MKQGPEVFTNRILLDFVCARISKLTCQTRLRILSLALLSCLFCKIIADAFRTCAFRSASQWRTKKQRLILFFFFFFLGGGGGIGRLFTSIKKKIMMNVKNQGLTNLPILCVFVLKQKSYCDVILRMKIDHRSFYILYQAWLKKLALWRGHIIPPPPPPKKKKKKNGSVRSEIAWASNS